MGRFLKNLLCFCSDSCLSRELPFLQVAAGLCFCIYFNSLVALTFVSTHLRAPGKWVGKRRTRDADHHFSFCLLSCIVTERHKVHHWLYRIHPEEGKPLGKHHFINEWVEEYKRFAQHHFVEVSTIWYFFFYFSLAQIVSSWDTPPTLLFALLIMVGKCIFSGLVCNFLIKLIHEIT